MLPRPWVLALAQEPSVARAVRLAFDGSRTEAELVARNCLDSALPILQMRGRPLVAFVEIDLSVDCVQTLSTLVSSGLTRNDVVALVTDLRSDLVNRCQEEAYGAVLAVGPSPVAFLGRIAEEILARTP